MNPYQNIMLQHDTILGMVVENLRIQKIIDNQVLADIHAQELQIIELTRKIEMMEKLFTLILVLICIGIFLAFKILISIDTKESTKPYNPAPYHDWLKKDQEGDQS